MTSQRILALPVQLANQIAAGEVVERPASVLKELVENSIDAGATQIDIHIEAAGRELIKITDNGRGIHPDDLLLAMNRHATSKLHSSEQLSQISSLGFRGEALPSIASVSRLNLISKQADMECGWQVHSSSNQAEPASHPPGTSVSVAELFFNLPARRHFLRSDKTELHHLQTTFHRLALSRFDIGFNAHFSEKQSIRLPALQEQTQYAARIGKICGQAFLRNSVYLQQNYDTIGLQGWVGKASAHRAQTDVQYFFINGRVIKDRVINHAIRLAYGEHLPHGRQPAYVLYLTLPLDRVDVNVHPTKHEVRFRDARLIHGLLTRAVEEALAHGTSDASKQTAWDLPSADSAPQVAEASNMYAAPARQTSNALKNAANDISSGHKPLPFNLLFQRYALFTDPSPALIDLQLVDRESRLQQFKQAIETAQLASRPILVPAKLSIDASAQQLLEQHQRLLEQCGFTYALTATHITFRRIPFLLSQHELSSLLTAIVAALAATADNNTFVQQLGKTMPLVPVTSQAQAEQILLSFNDSPLSQCRHYRKLDSATLAGLFSN